MTAQSRRVADDEVRRLVSGSSTLPWSIMVHLTILSYTFCSPDNLVKRNYFAFSMSPIRFGFVLVLGKKDFPERFRPSSG